METYSFRYLFIGLAAVAVGLSSCSKGVTVSVHNPSSLARNAQVVEVDAAAITGRLGADFSVKDAEGNPVVTQTTYDGKILLQGDFPAGETRKYRFNKVSGVRRQASEAAQDKVSGVRRQASEAAQDKVSGVRRQASEAAQDKVSGVRLQSSDTCCVGQIRYDKQDDFAWENDRGGYRLYGPSYRQGGGKVAGYDIWTKSVDYPVLAARYDDHEFCHASYHKDHGSGMDVYTVGRTLGAGMNSLVLPDGELAYPCAYEKCDIIENGPLRMTAKITCYPETVGDDKGVVETRIISLDKGSWLNRTEVSYEGLSREYPMVNGIVIHKQNPNGYILDKEKRYLAYADLTDNKEAGNGIIFIGVVNPELPSSVEYHALEPNVGDATGHIMSHTSYKPGDSYVYYWGSGWSKGGVRGMKAWADYLADFHTALQTPLQVTVK